ncbi:MAG TPA: DUF559 domain-containing protein [Armatimonadota bacterium]|jgi:very-short-patch-repair endonuclease
MQKTPLDNSDIVTGSHPPKLREQAVEFRRKLTPAEKQLWASLQAGRLGGLHFRRQQVIDKCLADFYCHAVGMVIEVDGEIHDGQRERDADRDSFLRGRGLLVMRFSNRRVMNDLRAVLSEIQVAAAARIAAVTALPPCPPP